MYNANSSMMEKLYNSPIPQSVVSQKAKSIWWIKQNLQFNFLPSVYLKPSQEITEDILKSISFPAFVRSCPMNPRPGVIESDIARQKESFSAIFDYLSHKMSKKHEEMGDIVVQPFIPAVANIVWTSGIMVIGPGHDGATNARYPTIIINALAPDFYKQALHDLSLPAAEIEMVIDENMSVWVTQIRSTSLKKLSIAPGPRGAFPGLLSHSPLRIADYPILTIKDLSGIETLCKQIKKEEKAIVYHPHGSPLSHIASLCFDKNYSYVTSDIRDAEWLSEPTRGWVIKGRSLDDSFQVDYFPDDFFEGIENGVKPTSPSNARKLWKTILPFHHYAQEMLGAA
jgi:hypothetical protein